MQVLSSFLVAFDFELRLIGGLSYLPDGIHPYGFFFPGARFPGDTNANLECLRRILEKTGVEKLPRVLYIQLDNTAKDNKNFKLLKYLAYLVLAGYVSINITIRVLFRYFDRVEVYFLPVGHTHGQIDQMFSCLAKWLKKWPASTLEELQASLNECYNNPKKTVTTLNRKSNPKRASVHTDEQSVTGHPVISEVVDSVVDVDKWLEGLEDPTARKHYTLKGSHAFQLTLDSTRTKVILKTKQYADNEHWLVWIVVC